MANSARPNEYYTEVVVSTTDVAGVIGKVAIDPGFSGPMSQMWVKNDKASSVYLSLTSSVGSTGGIQVKTNESFAFSVMTGVFSLASTTTSTGTMVRCYALRT